MWKRIQTGLLLCVVGAGGVWSVWKLWPSAEATDRASTAAAAVDEGAPPLLALPQEKLSAIGLQQSTVQRRSMRAVVTAPGRVQYDDTRHVEIKTATAGVLVDVRVKPGDQVEAGAIVAVVSSPEVGAARADVLQREADQQVANELRDWKQATCDGLQRLVEAVRAEQPLDKIRREFQGTQLGAAREQILTAFGKYTLARAVADNLQSAAQSGAVPQRTFQEAQSARDTAAAALDSILEQSLFDSLQQCREAANAAADVERRLQVSRQHLWTLLGFVGEMAGRQAAVNPQSNLSLVEVRAPFAGTIERKAYSATERVSQGDTLVVLADTSRLWITADLREREWDAAQLQAGDELQVSFPVLGGTPFAAHVYFVGREVDPTTNALPLVALIDNAEGRLRPGMFAQISLPIGTAKDTLAIPTSAVCEHQGTRFVFCPESPTNFRRVDVETGVTQGEWIEVRAGLPEGAEIVTAGCFQLKSELLLEREE